MGIISKKIILESQCEKYKDHKKYKNIKMKLLKDIWDYKIY